MRTFSLFLLLASSLAFLFAGSGNPRAEDAALFPKLPEDFEGVSHFTLTRMPFEKIQLGSHAVVFDETTLEVLRHGLGGIVHEVGQTAEHERYLCYTIPVVSGFERIWILSNREMGGDEKMVTSIIATRLDGASAENGGCPALLSRTSLSMDGLDPLGLSRDALIARLGPPSRERGAFLEFTYLASADRKTVLHSTDDLHNLSSFYHSRLLIEMKAGRVERFWISGGITES